MAIPHHLPYRIKQTGLISVGHNSYDTHHPIEETPMLTPDVWYIIMAKGEKTGLPELPNGTIFKNDIHRALYAGDSVLEITLEKICTIGVNND